MEEEYRRQAAQAQAAWQQQQAALLKTMPPDQINDYAKATGGQLAVYKSIDKDGKPTAQMQYQPQGYTPDPKLPDAALYDDFKWRNTYHEPSPNAYTPPSVIPADQFPTATAREPQYVMPDDTPTVQAKSPGGEADLPPTEGKATPTTAPTAPKTFNWEEWLKMFGSGELG